jgi:hypothetical protein
LGIGPGALPAAGSIWPTSSAATLVGRDAALVEDVRTGWPDVTRTGATCGRSTD